MDGEFKRYHLTIVDILEEGEVLEREQAILNDHKDMVAALLDCLACLVSLLECKVKPKADMHQHLQSRLQHLEWNLHKVTKAVCTHEVQFFICKY